MKIQPTEQFRKDYQRLPKRLQGRVDKALGLLLENPHHRSLYTKKLKGYENRWESRVTLHYRFTFTPEGDTYILLRVGTHDLIE